MTQTTPAAAYEPSHVYLSTGCLHGFHDYCSTAVRPDGGPKKPATCKFCDAVCVCACHRQPAHRVVVP